MYDLDEHFSTYASYTEIFMPQMLRPDRNNKMVEPDEGKNYEVGRGEFFDGRLNTSLAYFEIHEENRAEEDTEFNNISPNALVDWAYVGIQKPKAMKPKSPANWHRAGKFKRALICK